jgi:hypothetical protein
LSCGQHRFLPIRQGGSIIALAGRRDGRFSSEQAGQQVLRLRSGKGGILFGGGG